MVIKTAKIDFIVGWFSFPPGVFPSQACRDDKCLDAEQTLRFV